MPTYEYVCANGHPYKEERRMKDGPQRTTCPKPDCGKELKRKFETSPIMFKGSGFYSTNG